MKLLFVCMGNICRSPAAEGVMRHLLENAGLQQIVTVDSAGTIDLHTGELPDQRIRRAAEKRGIHLVHRARQMNGQDLRKFDLILAMDQDKLRDVCRLDVDSSSRHKIKSFCEFCTKHLETEVPDPYYGDAAGFELVLDLLDDGCAEIMRRIRAGVLLPA